MVQKPKKTAVARALHSKMPAKSHSSDHREHRYSRPDSALEQNPVGLRCSVKTADQKSRKRPSVTQCIYAPRLLGIAGTPRRVPFFLYPLLS